MYVDSSISAMAVSGSTAGYSYIQTNVNNATDFEEWRSSSLTNLSKIQENENRFDEIISIVRELDGVIADEFVQAKEIFPLFKQGMNGPEELGTLFRNPMEHLQGRIWERTKKIFRTEKGTNLQGKIQWATIAECTAKNGLGSFEYSGPD